MIGPIFLMQPIPYLGEKIDENWIAEPKIDGWRMQIIRYEDGRVEFWGRRLEKNPNWTNKLKRFVPLVEKFLPPESILDSEITDERGRRYIPSIFTDKKDSKPVIYVFDVIFLEGKEIHKLPLKERRKILEKINFIPPFFIIEQFEIKNNIEELLKKVKENNWEGIILKHKDSTYEIGKGAPRATEFWRKIK
ncbi:MAG: RNA ligase family protein [candidate division WOR-3 bacterium]